MTSENLAKKLSKNSDGLYHRLLEAKSCLDKVFRKALAPWTYDPKGKRLLSKHKKFALVWRIRRFPNKPIDSKNQQTSRGVVILKKL